MPLRIVAGEPAESRWSVLADLPSTCHAEMLKSCFDASCCGAGMRSAAPLPAQNSAPPLAVGALAAKIKAAPIGERCRSNRLRAAQNIEILGQRGPSHPSTTTAQTTQRICRPFMAYRARAAHRRKSSPINLNGGLAAQEPRAAPHSGDSPNKQKRRGCPRRLPSLDVRSIRQPRVLSGMTTWAGAGFSM